MSAYQVGAAAALTLLPPLLLEPPELAAPTFELPPEPELAPLAVEPPLVEAPLLEPGAPAAGALSPPQPTSEPDSARQSEVATVGVKARKAQPF
jgi:hypothetical protein